MDIKMIAVQVMTVADLFEDSERARMLVMQREDPGNFHHKACDTVIRPALPRIKRLIGETADEPNFVEKVASVMEATLKAFNEHAKTCVRCATLAAQIETIGQWGTWHQPGFQSDQVH